MLITQGLGEDKEQEDKEEEDKGKETQFVVAAKPVEKKKTKVTPKKQKTTLTMEEPLKVYPATRACTCVATAKESAPKVKTNVKRTKMRGEPLDIGGPSKTIRWP